MSDRPPKEIGKYHIIELIGEGAMGVVYRATDSVLGRTVAIKVMSASIARQEDLRQRFLREAQAAGSLQHPNVVTIYDLGELEGHLFIAMEYVHGTDLEKLMDLSEPLSLQSKLDIVVDVLTGLSYAHRKGIVHRDIKPQNIRVGDDGRAKIMDFGVAHLASSSITRTGLVVGTPSYMAPEQVMGGKALPETDIFAVGAVLYQLLTGDKPFEAPTLQSLFYKIVTDMPKPIVESMPGLPPALDRITRKALAKDPAARYSTALEMANEITHVRAQLSGAPYPASISLETVAVTKAEAESTLAAEKNAAAGKTPAVATVVASEKPARRLNPMLLGAAGAAAVLLVAWLAFGQKDSDELSDPPINKPAQVSPVNENSVASTTTTDSEVPASAPRVDPAPAPAPAAVPPPAPVAAAKKRDTRAVQQSTMERIRESLKKRSVEKKATAIPPPPPPPPVVRAPVVAPPSVVAQQPPPRETTTLPVRPPPPAAPDPAPAKVESPANEIAGVVSAYARAIESRDLGAVRRAYPGLTSEQARGFEQFFESARSINVTFRIVGLEASGNSADARLVGTYEYVSGARTERQPVSFAASLRNDGSSWRLVSVR